STPTRSSARMITIVRLLVTRCARPLGSAFERSSSLTTRVYGSDRWRSCLAPVCREFALRRHSKLPAGTASVDYALGARASRSVAPLDSHRYAQCESRGKRGLATGGHAAREPLSSSLTVNLQGLSPSRSARDAARQQAGRPQPGAGSR